MRRSLRAAAFPLVVAALGIAAGTGTAAPAESGAVLAFGNNSKGQLGSTTNNDTTTANPTPVAFAPPADTGAIVQIAAGAGHTLFVTASGKVFGLGQNDIGQLGAPASATPTATPMPIALPGLFGEVTRVAAGAVFSLVLTESGQLYGFGSNQYGQLGNATNNNSFQPNPNPTLITLPGQVGIITQIAAGLHHSLVLTSTGQLYAFGQNQFGQLGSTTNNTIATANPTPALVTLPGQIGTIAQIAGGGYHSLVLTSSGQLYAFGWNLSGQLGNANNSGTNAPTPTPTLVTLPGQTGVVAQIAGGAYHSLAATTGGQLYAFGHNESGQLGTATNTNTGNPNPVPALVPLAGRVGQVTQLAGGDDHTLVVTSSGQLYSFGYNYFGQIGRPANIGTMVANPTPALVPLPAGTTIDTVAKGPGSYHSLALISNLAITADALPAAQVGKDYRETVVVSGGTRPRTWAATGLPRGLEIEAASGVIKGTPLDPGVSSPTITVTDMYGSSVSREQRLTVVAAGAPPPGAIAPRLSAVKQSASRWVAGTKLARLVTTTVKPARKHGLPVGTTFSFGLDQPARVTFAFQHGAQGRKVSGKCVAKSKANAGKPSCRRIVRDGALRVQARAGGNLVRFEGRISATRKLKAGRYTVLVTATSNGKTSSARSRSFTVVAP